jgi:WD40 repeat protein/serine/threonine protein kinase
LRAEVAELLAHDDRPAGFFRTVDFDAGQVLSEHLRDPELLEMPIRVGSYRPMRVLGEGGFGIVYLAQQESPRRTVALKLIRPGLTSRSALRRFKYEAEVLGRLHHPYVAQVFEAGTAEVEIGAWERAPENDSTAADENTRAIPQAAPAHVRSERQAFVAMEYVPGLPITRYARDRQTTVRDRVELMARVCDGVQHAHQKGVIHRDLKPANILVVVEGAETGIESSEKLLSTPRASDETRSFNAHPKILDFGVARAADPGQGQMTTMQTGVGQLIGTLPYMSPEQVAGDPAELDTRADVYALGIVLFELLTGQLPFNVSGRPVAEAARMIQEAPLPRVSSFNRHLRGEIEVIIAKALDRDRSRRYQSAAELGEDLRRYLRGEPIAARRDSAFYVLRKQLRRYWAALAVATAFVVLLTLFAIHQSSQSARFSAVAHREAAAKEEALRAWSEAERERQRADENRAALAFELSISNIERGRLLTRMEKLGAAEDHLWREYFRNPGSRAADGAMWEFFSRYPVLRTIPYYEGEFAGVVLSRDGRWCVESLRNGRIRCWDAPRRTCYAEIDAFDSPISVLEVSNDGEMLAAAGDGIIRIWRPSDGARLGELRAHTGAVHSLDFSPDGRTLISGGADRSVRVWDLELMDERYSARFSRQQIYSVSCSRDGSSFAASSMDGAIIVRDLPSGRPTVSLSMPGAAAARDVLFLSNDQLVCAHSDGKLRVWDLAAADVVGEYETLGNAPASLVLGSDGRTLAIGGQETLEIWDADTWTRRVVLVEHDPGLFEVSISHDCREIATVHTAQLRFWETSRNRGMLEAGGHKSWVFGLAVQPGGRLAATGDAGGRIYLWNPADLTRVGWLARESITVRPLAFSPDGRQLAVGVGSNAIEIWEVASRQMRASFPFSGGSITSLEFSRDGQTLLVGSGGGRVCLLRAEDGSVVRDFENVPEHVSSATFSPDGTRVLAAGYFVPCIAWDAQTGEQLAIRRSDVRNAWHVVCSPDGKTIATSVGRRSVELLHPETLSPVTTLLGHNYAIVDMKFSEDGRALVTGSADGTIQLWDIPTGNSLVTLDAGSGEVSCVAFLPGGQQLLSAGRDGHVRRWDLRYFDRHIEGNLAHQLDRAVTRLRTEVDREALDRHLRVALPSSEASSSTRGQAP